MLCAVPCHPADSAVVKQNTHARRLSIWCPVTLWPLKSNNSAHGPIDQPICCADIADPGTHSDLQIESIIDRIGMQTFLWAMLNCKNAIKYIMKQGKTQISKSILQMCLTGDNSRVSWISLQMQKDVWIVPVGPTHWQAGCT